MSPKFLEMSVKLTNVHVGAANILKQEMLSQYWDPEKIPKKIFL